MATKFRVQVSDFTLEKLLIPLYFLKTRPQVLSLSNQTEIKFCLATSLSSALATTQSPAAHHKSIAKALVMVRGGATAAP